MLVGVQGLAQLKILRSLEVSGFHEIVVLPGVEHCRMPVTVPNYSGVEEYFD
jgi:hypothetical protein